jgi:Uma2 family endonuclease
MAASEILEKRFTYEDYKALDVDDTYLYELINGELVKKAAPSPAHQRILKKLFLAMNKHVETAKSGELLFAPIDVFLDETNVPQPDLVFVSTAKNSLITDDGIMGIPDLVVEIISPSSFRRDRFDKFRLYKTYGIPEFWLIDPANRSVEVYTFSQAHHDYDLRDAFAETGLITSVALPEFKIEIAELFG